MHDLLPDSPELERDFFEIERVINGLSLGVSGWDAIVDASLSASDPGSRNFKGIYEAIDYLGGTAALTNANILIRPGTYTESSGVVFGTITALWLHGSSPDSVTPAVSWTPSGNFSVPHALQMDNIAITVPAGAGWTLGGGSVLYLDNCLLNINSNTGTTVNVTATYIFAYDSSFISTTASNFNVNAFNFNGNNQNVFVGVEFASNGSSLSVPTWTFTSGSQGTTYFYGKAAGRFGTLTFSTACAVATLDQSSANRVGVGPSFNPFDVVMSPTTLGQLMGNCGAVTLGGNGSVCHLDGTFAAVSITTGVEAHIKGKMTSLTSSSANAFGSVNGEVTNFLDLQGKHWVADVTGATPSSPYLRCRSGVNDSLFRCGSTQTSAGTTPYQLDAGTNRNILDFAGSTTFTNPGVDNGTGNLVRVT